MTACCAQQIRDLRSRGAKPAVTKSARGTLAICALSLALASCAHKQPPEPVVRVVETKVAVRVPCVDSTFPAKPATPSREAILQMSPEDRLKAIGSDWILLDPWSRLASDALEICKRPSENPPK